eukprot:2891723-Amphidinium_carterae.1
MSDAWLMSAIAVASNTLFENLLRGAERQCKTSTHHISTRSKIRCIGRKVGITEGVNERMQHKQLHYKGAIYSPKRSHTVAATVVKPVALNTHVVAVDPFRLTATLS